MPMSDDIGRRYGYLGINLDTAWGGAGASHLDAAIVVEAVAIDVRKINIASALVGWRFDQRR
jgi:alkylation response protein AidB-like acyl-CoA dehydrogenase